MSSGIPLHSSEVTGLVVIDKPKGMTSHDVVNWVRRLLGIRRVGHTGTLDPIATGVLVLCVGQATRLAEYLSASRKAYWAEVVFGLETDSGDVSGSVVVQRSASHLTANTVGEALSAFRGTIFQRPPMVSARRYEGQRLYKLARQGVVVEREPKPVQIERLELMAFSPGEHPVATLEVVCSSGTYIRALATDIGTALGVGGAMKELRRLWVGKDAEHAFSLQHAHTLEELQQLVAGGDRSSWLLPLTSALADWPKVSLSEEQLERVRYGQALPLSHFQNRFVPAEGGLCALLSPEGNLVAVAEVRTDRLQPVKVLCS